MLIKASLKLQGHFLECMQEQEPLSLLWCKWGLNCKNQASLWLVKVNNTENQARLGRATLGIIHTLHSSHKQSPPVAGQYSKFEPACGGPQWLNQSKKSSPPAAGPLQIQARLLLAASTNILYCYLVVLNVKIRNHFLGTLPALGTVRRSWKDELNRVKTSHPLWLNRSQKSSPENSILPENCHFRDVSVNISRMRMS